MITARDIIEVLRRFTADEEEWYLNSPESDFWHWGTTRYRGKRIAAVADLACQHGPGDIAEIGCERGVTTIELIQVAVRHGRRVVAVDPWDEQAHPGSTRYYEEFVTRMAAYEEILDVVRLDSRSMGAIDSLRRPLAFAFVDGLHTYGACLSDIRAVHHAGIICVDDYQNNWKMLGAFAEGAGERRKIAHPWCKEKYIL